jgi:hypothetical protein
MSLKDTICEQIGEIRNAGGSINNTPSSFEYNGKTYTLKPVGFPNQTDMYNVYDGDNWIYTVIKPVGGECTFEVMTQTGGRRKNNRTKRAVRTKRIHRKNRRNTRKH